MVLLVLLVLPVVTLNLVTILPKLVMMMATVMVGMIPVGLRIVMVRRVDRTTNPRVNPGDSGVETGHLAGGDTRGVKPTKAGIVLGGPRNLATGGTTTRGGTIGMDGVLHLPARVLQMAGPMRESPRNPQRIRGHALSPEETRPDGRRDLSLEAGSQPQTPKERATVANHRKEREDLPKR